MLAGLLVPPRCALCAAPAPRGEVICPECDRSLAAASAVPLALPRVEAAWAAAPHQGRARELIVALKFAGRLALAERVARAIACAAPEGLLAGALVPVPPVSSRRRWRGFDPAEVIARALARQTGLELRPCLRRLDRGRQVGRSRRQRLSDPPRIGTVGPAPERALLVDDVVTTGATLVACAAALRAAGTRHVSALAFAHTAAPLGRAVAGPYHDHPRSKGEEAACGSRSGAGTRR